MALRDLRLAYGNSSGEIRIERKGGQAHRLLDVYLSDQLIDKLDYLDVRVGNIDLTRIPLKAHTFDLCVEPYQVGVQGSIFGMIRAMFGEDAIIEADEDEDIILTVKDFSGAGHNIAYGAVALYEVISTGIDKTKLLRSMCEDSVIFPLAYAEVSAGATYDKTVPMDKCLQQKGLLEVADGFTIPSGTELVTKAMIGDYYTDGTSGNISKAMLHIKDRTYEFLDPEGMAGIDVRHLRNLFGINLETGYYFNTMNYVFSSGHKIVMEAEVERKTSEANKTDRYMLAPAFLVRRL